MSKLKTAGELRGFLADTLADIRSGIIDTNKANAIAKIAAQINASLQVEVTTALQLEKMGGGTAVAGSMVIATHETEGEMVRQLPQADPVLDRAMDVIDTPVEIAPKPIAAPKPKFSGSVPKLVEPGTRVFCDQCDRNVTVAEGMACTSAFCKAAA